MKIARPTKFQTLTGCVAVVAAVVCVGWIFLRSDEPAWQGHRVSEWIDVYDSHTRGGNGDSLMNRIGSAAPQVGVAGFKPMMSLFIWVKWCSPSFTWKPPQGAFSKELPPNLMRVGTSGLPSWFAFG